MDDQEQIIHDLEQRIYRTQDTLDAAPDINVVKAVLENQKVMMEAQSEILIDIRVRNRKEQEGQ